MSSFNPTRLAVGRKRRGLSKKALADKATVGLRTLTALESGTEDPLPGTVARLAEVLGFPILFFYADDSDMPAVDGVSFRALKRMTARQRDQALSAGAFAYELSEWMDQRFSLPPTDIPRLRGIDDPQAAAQVVRQMWGLGEQMIKNMIHLLEAHGVRVFSLVEECREIDAFSSWYRDRPFIFLNTIKSAEHSRMDSAHELGHLVLHWQEPSMRGRDLEAEAKAFASAFLMPAGSVMASAPRQPTLDQLTKVKRRWGVAVAALVYRMRQLNLLTEWQARSLYIELSKQGWAHEPEEMPRETSQVLDKVFRALRAEGIRKADVAQELHLFPDELDKLVFGLLGLTRLAGEGESSAETEEARPSLKLV